MTTTTFNCELFRDSLRGLINDGYIDFLFLFLNYRVMKCKRTWSETLASNNPNSTTAKKKIVNLGQSNEGANASYRWQIEAARSAWSPTPRSARSRQKQHQYSHNNRTTFEHIATFAFAPPVAAVCEDARLMASHLRRATSTRVRNIFLRPMSEVLFRRRSHHKNVPATVQSGSNVRS